MRDRLQGIRTARRVEPATGRQRRAYPTTVRDDRCRNEPGGQLPCGDQRSSIAPRRRGSRGRPSAASRSRPEVAVRRGRPTPGSARTTSRGRRAGRRADPGPGGAAGAGPCYGPPRCRPPWTRRSRRAPTADCSCDAPARVGRLVKHQDAQPRARDRRDVRRGSVCGEVLAPPQSLRGRQHDLVSRALAPAQADRRSRPLDAARREDGAPGAGAHAQPETVGLRAPAVVRLVGALAHVRLRLRMLAGTARPVVGFRSAQRKAR